MNKQVSTGEDVIVIHEDMHNERPGYFRAYYASSPDASTCVTVIGYCSPGGSHRTIRATVNEVRRLGHTAKAYRNGRELPY